MWVYYLVLGVVFTVLALKVIDTVAATLKNQRDSVRKQDFLDALIETLLIGK